MLKHLGYYLEEKLFWKNMGRLGDCLMGIFERWACYVPYYISPIAVKLQHRFPQ